MIYFLLGFILGFLFKLYFPSKRKFRKYWKKHPIQEKVFIVLSIPLTIFMLPYDYYKYGTTIKEYIQMYKELLFDRSS